MGTFLADFYRTTIPQYEDHRKSAKTDKLVFSIGWGVYAFAMLAMAILFFSWFSIAYLALAVIGGWMCKNAWETFGYWEKHWQGEIDEAKEYVKLHG